MIPATAQQAFAARTQMAAVRGEELSTLVPIAAEVMRTDEPSANVPNARSAPNAWRYRQFADGSDEGQARSAIELLAEFTAADDPDGVVEALVEDLRSSRREVEAERLLALQRLYAASEADFATTVAELLAAPQPRYRGQGAEPVEPINDVIMVLDRRELAIESIADVVIANFADNVPNSFSAYDPPAFIAFASKIAESGAEPSAVFVEKLAEILLGSADERAEMIERFGSTDTYVARGKAGRVLMFRTIVQQAFLSEPETVWLGVNALADFPEDEWVGSYIEWGVSRSITSVFTIKEIDDDAEAVGGETIDPAAETAERVVAFLQASPFINDGDDFRDFQGDVFAERSAFRLFINLLQAPEQVASSEAVTAFIAGMDKPTLGSELIRISLESRSRAQR
ncbi:MAG: hypothetical protein AAF747_02280, partial [Planctomycetota bacterium]